MTAYYLSFGCKVNQYETNALRGMLSQEGIQPVEQPEDADLILVNSCTVTASSDRKVRHALRSLRSRCPNAKIVLTGCLPQAHPDAAQLCPEADLITGTKDRAALIQRIRQLMESSVPCDGVTPHTPGEAYELLPPAENADRTRAFIKIQDGCNQFCSYCIIPYARGRVRSRQEEDVLNEVKGLVAAGYQEIVLTGIHLSSYGIDRGEAELLGLIRKLQEIEGLRRIRLGSLEPRIITEEFARELASLSKVCPHFHLSLQSGCDSVLKRMNRRYDSGEYYEKTQLLRKYFHNPAITTDVIVGFPGETEEEFRETEAFVRKVQFFEMHIFKYSRRHGTRAAEMEGQLTEAQKAARSAVLLELEKEMSHRYRESLIGTEVEVLLEESKEIGGQRYWIGHTPQYVRVAVPAQDDAGRSNELVRGVAEGFLDDDVVLLRESV